MTQRPGEDVSPPLHIMVPAEAVNSQQRGGRVFLLPGSQGRARDIAGRLRLTGEYPSPRGHDVFCGTFESDGKSIDVGVVSTGMGSPSVGVIVHELASLGVQTYLRVGTAGSLQPAELRAGAIVIATAAVRDEGASLAYAPAAFPAVASTELTAALFAAAHRELGETQWRAGIVHSKDSLHAREFAIGPRRQEHEAYMRMLTELGVLASEMEASHLFVLASALSRLSGATLHAGAVLAVVSGQEDEASRAGIDAAIRVALAAAHAYVTLPQP